MATSLVAALSGGWASPALANGGPARGAPIGDLAWATGVATVLTAAVLWLAMAHRSGRIQWLGRLARSSERVTGLPGWAGLPVGVTGASLVTGMIGFYWDVAKHIDTGRDPGPFGTAAHYPILACLFGITLGGFLAIVLGAPEHVRTSIRLGRGWRAPVGGLLIFLCGACGLAGFPLDDVWHTLFGQDVTLWGPTHILMVGGASLAALGVWVLLIEASRASAAEPGAAPAAAARPLGRRVLAATTAGAFLIGLSTLQGEFDYGLPQFQLVYQPILVMLAAGIGLVAARVRLGRGGALAAALFFLAARALLTVLIGPILHETTLHFPLYLPEAVLVELVARRLPRERPLTLGVAAGALIGTVGLAAEWGWSHVWMPLPWPASLLPEAVVLGFAAAVAGGVIGAFIGRALTAGRRTTATTTATGRAAPRWLLPLAGAVAVVCIAYPLPMDAGPPTSATLGLKDLKSAPQRTVAATVRLSPPDAAEGSQWLTVTAWQGGGLVVDRLRRVGPRAYRTTEPIPVHGEWKTMLRLEDGRGLRAVPIYLPADPAIPARAVVAPAEATRPFVRDKRILQREAVGGSAWLAAPAYLLLLAIAASWLAALGWGLHRLERSGRPARPGGEAPRAVPRVEAVPA